MNSRGLWPPDQLTCLELVELCTNKIGCWLITQPDRGSDVGVMYADDWPAGAPGNKGNVTARVTDSEIILNGQCSAWVSNPSIDT